MKNFLKSNNGITLVALVVTIIVLLILAGVSLNLVAGSNGILSRENNAVNATNLAKIKEELELKIAELQLDYYSESSLQLTYTSANTYVKAQLSKESGIVLPSGVMIKADSDGNLLYEGTENIGTLNADGTITINGIESGSVITPQTKYTVTYNANGGSNAPTDSTRYNNGDTVTVDFSTTPTKKGSNFLGWATSSSATTPEYTSSGSFTITKNTTLYAVWEKLLGTAAIQPEFYGDKVKYSANSVNDWQVFLNDGSNVYLISSDYVPSSGMTITSDVAKVTESDYTVKGNSRNGLVNWLTTESNWSSYASGFSETTATGGATLSQFWASYNGKCGTSYSAEYQDLSSTLEYNNTLYFPHMSEWNNTIGYWLASPISTDSDRVELVRYDRYVTYYAYDSATLCIRPLVKLPATAKITWNGTAWELNN